MEFGKISAMFRNYLQEAGVHAVDAWEQRRECTDCVVVVSLESCEITGFGIGDYLGSRERDGQEVEVYGKRGRVTLGLRFYAAVSGGEEKIQAELQRVVGILSKGEGSQFELHKFSTLGTVKDELTSLLKREVKVESLVYVYWEEGSEEPYMDFRIEGEMKDE